MKRLWTYAVDLAGLVLAVVALLALAWLDEPVEFETWSDS